MLINLCRRAPLLAGATTLAYVDVDDAVKATFGYAKQGASRGYTGVKGLNVLLAIISTPTSRPVIGHHRLDRLQPEHVEAMFASLEADGLAPATVLQCQRILSRALRVAVQRGKVARNVCTLVRRPRARPAPG